MNTKGLLSKKKQKFYSQIRSPELSDIAKSIEYYLNDLVSFLLMNEGQRLYSIGNPNEKPYT